MLILFVSYTFMLKDDAVVAAAAEMLILFLYKTVLCLVLNLGSEMPAAKVILRTCKMKSQYIHA